MLNEVLLIERVRFFHVISIVFVLFFLNCSNAGVSVKLTQYLPDEEEEIDLFQRLSYHKQEFLKSNEDVGEDNNFSLITRKSLRIGSDSRFKSNSDRVDRAEAKKRFRVAIHNLKNYKDSQYVAEFKVGEPPQLHKIVFDTGSSNFWLTSIKCDVPSCKIHQQYDGSKSKYYQDIHKAMQVKFGSGKVSGKFVKDKVEFGPLTIYDQEFGLIEHQEGRIFKYLKFSGILGMSFPKLSKSKSTPFFDNVINNGLLKQNMFSFYLAKKGEDGDSQLIFGKPSKNYYTGEIEWHKVIQENYWTMKLDDVYVGNKRMTNCGKNGCKVILDSGTSIITFPRKYYRDIVEQIGIDQCPLEKDERSNLPSITFKINGKNYTLDGKDYMYKTFKVGNKVKCHDGFLPLDIAAPKGPIWILGDMFMRKYFAIHDRDNKRIGLALRKKGVKSLPQKEKIKISP